MGKPAPANDYTTPGQDLLVALQLACDEMIFASTQDAADAITGKTPWREVSHDARDIFERAAARFLSEDGEE